tara:strand:+ start:877 stop:1671 length:795 start_codon:yes stop_codon:yes gene_type:complete
MIRKHFKRDFAHLLGLLKENKPFAFTRFSDGELYILQNRECWIKTSTCQVREQVHQGFWGEEELKSFNPETDQSLREKLQECFSHKQENYFKGISCKCCVGEKDWAWQFENAVSPDEEYLTWANLLINGNYIDFITQMFPAMKEHKVVYTCNKLANLKKLPLDLVKDFRVGQNCHINDIHLVEEMKEWISKNKIQNHLFLFSAASLSNILIYELYKEFPNNIYMDIGSTLNPMLDLDGWKGSRGYLKGHWLNAPEPNYYKICEW